MLNRLMTVAVVLTGCLLATSKAEAQYGRWGVHHHGHSAGTAIGTLYNHTHTVLPNAQYNRSHHGDTRLMIQLVGGLLTQRQVRTGGYPSRSAAMQHIRMQYPVHNVHRYRPPMQWAPMRPTWGHH